MELLEIMIYLKEMYQPTSRMGFELGVCKLPRFIMIHSLFPAMSPANCDVDLIKSQKMVWIPSDHGNLVRLIQNGRYIHVLGIYHA